MLVIHSKLPAIVGVCWWVGFGGLPGCSIFSCGLWSSAAMVIDRLIYAINSNIRLATTEAIYIIHKICVCQAHRFVSCIWLLCKLFYCIIYESWLYHASDLFISCDNYQQKGRASNLRHLKSMHSPEYHYTGRQIATWSQILYEDKNISLTYLISNILESKKWWANLTNSTSEQPSFKDFNQ